MNRLGKGIDKVERLFSRDKPRPNHERNEPANPAAVSASHSAMHNGKKSEQSSRQAQAEGSGRVNSGGGGAHNTLTKGPPNNQQSLSAKKGSKKSQSKELRQPPEGQASNRQNSHDVGSERHSQRFPRPKGPKEQTTFYDDTEPSGPPEVSDDEGLDEATAALRKIYRALLHVKHEHPDFQYERDITSNITLGDVEMAIRSLTKAYGEVLRGTFDLETTFTGMEKSFEELRKDRDHLFQQNEKLQDTEKKLLKENGFLEGTNRKQEEELLALERQQKDAIEKLQQSHKAKSEKLNGEIRLWKNTNQHAIDRYEEKIGNISAENEEEKRQIRIRYDGEIHLRDQRHKKEMWDLENSKQRMEYDLREEINSIRSESDRNLQERDDRILALETSHESELARVKQILEAEKVREIRILQGTVEQLKGALVKRDHFKAMSDHEVAQRFQDISTEIDDLARTTWERGLETSWPFREYQLQSATNKREMKQFIIQNTLWVVLYENIFCTPFRILGNEGRKFESEWVNTFGQAGRSLMPKPTKEAEKWRYELMKKCIEATSAPLMEGEAFYNVKRQYESALADASDDMSQELGRVAQVGGSEKQRVRDLVKKAARLQLEVSQQRCRFFLVMSDSGQEPVRSKESSLRGGRMGLVVVPEVRRIGNAQGERLEKEELVMDCTGKFSMFSAK